MENVRKSSIQVVRVRTHCFEDSKGGIHFQKSLIPLKRKSEGHQVLSEDVSMIGVDEVVERIENLLEVKDGIYKVVIVNEFKDWETGHIEDYDYKLVPYEPNQVR